MSIASEITRLQNAKSALKASIMAKGVMVADNDKIDTYASKVDSIQAGDTSGGRWTGHVDTEGLKGLGWSDAQIAYLQKNVWWNKEDDDVWKVANVDSRTYQKVTDNIEPNSYVCAMDLSGFDTSDITSFQNLFYRCISLVSLDLSGFDTSRVVNMSQMFIYCYSLVSLDLSGFDTSKVTNMSNLFYNCSSLVSLDLSGFDTSRVTTMSQMFMYCSSLVSLDLSGFDTSRVTTMKGMFSGCRSLKCLKIRNVKLSLDLSATCLTKSSLMYIINNLAEVSGETLTLGDVLLDLLNDDEKAIATGKGWTLA